MRQNLNAAAGVSVLVALLLAGAGLVGGVKNLINEMLLNPNENISVSESAYRSRDLFQFGDARSERAKETKAPEADGLALQGFVENNGTYSVIINDRQLEKGGRINGWRVESVTRNSAVLSRNGETRVLR
jgi:hypothetical protein